MTIARRLPVNLLFLTALFLASLPELAWAMPKMSREIFCRVVEVDVSRRLLLVEREGGGQQTVFEIAWNDRTVAFASSRKSSPEGLAVGARIHLSYVRPLFLPRRIARRLVWQDRATRTEVLNRKGWRRVDS